MTRWIALREDINEARTRCQGTDLQNAMVVELTRAVKLGICSKMAPYWIARDGDLVGLLRHGDATIGEHRAILLQKLPALDDAKLTFRIVLNWPKGLREYTVGVVGKERKSGRDWYVRIDLDPEQRGRGPCHHPMLHCHVGVDATEKGVQETRAPLPWLYPHEALAWILATLHDQLEPAAE